jgi:hypothetical protein
VDGNCIGVIPDLTSVATVGDNCGVASVTQTPVGGSTVGPGLAVITITVTDNSGNTNSCNVGFTYVDVTPPTLVCPGPGTVSVDGNCEFVLPNLLLSSDISDNCGVVSVNQSPAPGTVVTLGVTIVTLSATDAAGNSSSCDVAITVVDTTLPTVSCNAQATIVPPDAPISFTATATDNCGVSVEIVDFDCFAFTKKGKRIDKTESCVIEIDGGTVTIVDSGGVGTTIEWTVVATDSSGNTSTVTCTTVVENPGGGGGSDANEGVGNGEDANTPGHDNNGGNDDPQFSPGNPGGKNK